MLLRRLYCASVADDMYYITIHIDLLENNVHSLTMG